MKNKLISLLLILFLSQYTFSLNKGPQYLINSNHWIYDSLVSIFTESGKVHFYDQGPLTVQEVKVLLSEIDYNNLSDAGKYNYDLIQTYFEEENWGFKSDLLSFDAEFLINPEFQFKTNEDIQWIFDSRDRGNFIDCQLGIDVSKFISLGIDIPFTQSRSSRISHDNITNLPYNMENIDINFPHNTFMVIGFDLGEKTVVNFKISTLEQFSGRSNSGSVILSENLLDAVNAELKILSPKIMYAANITMLGLNRYMYIHKMDFKIKDKLTIGLFEGALPYGSFDLRYMNPFTIFHGVAGWYDYKNIDDNEKHDVGSYMGLKINFTPFSNLRIYSNFAMNQFQLPNEGDSSIPSGIGLQLGIEGIYPISNGYLRMWLEGGYTTPYFMINESPNWSFLRSYSETCSNSSKFYDWIGTPFGPDSISAKLTLGYEIPKKWGINLSYLFLARGELSRPNFGRWGGSNRDFDNTDRENWVHPSVTSSEKYKNGAKFRAPSGIPEYSNTFSIDAFYWPCEWLSLNVKPSLAFICNNNNVKGKFDFAFEFSLSAKCYLTRLFK